LDQLIPLQLDQETERMFAGRVQCDLIVTTELLHYHLDWKLLLDATPDLRAGSVGAEQTSFAGMQDHYAVIMKRRSSFGRWVETRIVNFVRHACVAPFYQSPLNAQQDSRVLRSAKSSKVGNLGWIFLEGFL
jgi:hypothetical protein